MRPRAALPLLFAAVPAAAIAEGTMPQMDFRNPLTSAQLLWMVVILVALYLLLARWALPKMAAVLENRAAVIARDLQAAREAKTAADRAVQALTRTMREARAKAHAEIAEAVAAAKFEAAVEAAAATARLDARLAEAEARIGQARGAAMAALKPVAKQAAAAMLARLTGMAPDEAKLAPRIDAALAARQA